jgi:threonine dehydratase
MRKQPPNLARKLMAIPDDLPTMTDIDAAASRIASVCIETPLLESPVLNARLGGRLLVKAENLQVTGSFKLRGAFNRLAVLSAEERRRGVVARSSGNHGLAIAYCASILNTHAIVVAPARAPDAKIHRIRSYGAEVILVDDPHDLATVADEITRNQHRVFVSPADDPWIVAGAGTVGREIVRQAASMGAVLDALLVCCSGGGLTSGCALALGALSPATSVYAVEPIGFEKMARSLAAGHRVNNEPGGHTICDALSGPYTAAIPFEIVRSRLAGGLAVSDGETKDAMRTAFAEFGLAVEPGGAVGLAAVMSGRFPMHGKTVAVTVSGRNVDLDLASRALAA